jgi:hypothetical protein
MISAQVYIETQLDTSTSFGVRVDNGERVFVNAKLAKRISLSEDDLRELTLLPNPDPTRTDTPWRAIGVAIATADEPEPEPASRPALPTLENRVTAHFADPDNGFPHTSPALAEALGVDSMLMQTTLTRMHNMGEMAKAQVFAKGGQRSASSVLWAPEAAWFSE